jgi:hypothetical protein
MAPVLTSLFTPLFAGVLLAFLGAVAWSGNGVDIERNVLIAFDLLLAVVLGLLLYSISARDPRRAPGAFDIVQVVLVMSALLANAGGRPTTSRRTRPGPRSWPWPFRRSSVTPDSLAVRGDRGCRIRVYARPAFQPVRKGPRCVRPLHAALSLPDSPSFLPHLGNRRARRRSPCPCRAWSI